jgi:hypothetical protein
VLGRLVPGNFSALGELNENALTVLGQREAWAAATRKAAQGGNDVARFEAWNSTGDKAWLAALNAAGIADKAQHMFMITKGNGGPTVLRRPTSCSSASGWAASRSSATRPGRAMR